MPTSTSSSILSMTLKRLFKSAKTKNEMEASNKIFGIFIVFVVLLILLMVSITIRVSAPPVKYESYNVINAETVDSVYHHNHITVFPDEGYHMYKFRLQAIDENNDTIQVYGWSKSKTGVNSYLNQTIQIKKLNNGTNKIHSSDGSGASN